MRARGLIPIALALRPRLQSNFDRSVPGIVNARSAKAMSAACASVKRAKKPCRALASPLRIRADSDLSPQAGRGKDHGMAEGTGTARHAAIRPGSGKRGSGTVARQAPSRR